MAESPKLVAGYPPSTSTRNSYSSEEIRTSTVGRPRTHTVPSSPLPSSRSADIPKGKDESTRSQEQPSKYLGAGRFFRPGSEDQSGWRLIRERASWSRSFSRPFDSRSEWPSASQRDLLKEAGDWLDVHFPVPDIPLGDGDSQLLPSPFQEEFPASSPRDISRPISASSSTKEDMNGADEKIVYNERESKLRELLDKMKDDFEEGRAPKHSRSARARKYMKEIQAQNVSETSTRNQNGLHPIELDASPTSGPIRGEDTSPDPLISDNSSPGDQSSHESGVYSLRLSESLERDRILQPLPAIDLSPLFDDEFSAATARALDDIPDPSKLDIGSDAEAAKTPTPTPQSNAQLDYFVTDNSHHSSPQAESLPPLHKSNSVEAQTLANRDSAASMNSSQAMSEQISLTTSRSGESSKESYEPARDNMPHLESFVSVFGDLDNLVKASRRRHADTQQIH